MGIRDGARGHYDVETPIEERELLEMHLSTRKEVAELAIATLKERLGYYRDKFGELDSMALAVAIQNEKLKFKKTELEEYFGLVYDLHEACDQLTQITSELELKARETYSTVFAEIAKKHIDPKTYSNIEKAAQGELNRLFQQA